MNFYNDGYCYKCQPQTSLNYMFPGTLLLLVLEVTEKVHETL